MSDQAKTVANLSLWMRDHLGEVRRAVMDATATPVEGRIHRMRYSLDRVAWAGVMTGDQVGEETYYPPVRKGTGCEQKP